MLYFDNWVMYGAETWVLTNADENALNIWERKILRKIFGPVQDAGIWRIRTNFMMCISGSSGSIVSDYGLDDRAIEVRSPTGADFSSSLCAQTGSGAHPATYPMGAGGSFPGGKARPGRDADHSPPSSAEVKNE
jgi:hypothetical protein